MTILDVNGQSDRKESRKDRRSSMKRTRKPPVEDARNGAAVDNDGVKEFYGDGLVVRLQSNHQTLKITGDSCRVTLSKNTGSVHIIGDSCCLSVDHNVGDIEYTGDGGRIVLGPRSSKKNVKFVGDDGKVIFDSAPEAVTTTINCGKFQKSNLKKSVKDQRNEEEETARSRDEVVGADREKGDGRYDDDWCVTMSSSNREGLDNAVNEVKERDCCQKGKHGKCDDQTTRKSLRHQVVVVTNIVTGVRGYSQCVRKRCGSSSLIVNAIGDARSSHRKSAVLRAFGTSIGIE